MNKNVLLGISIVALMLLQIAAPAVHASPVTGVVCISQVTSSCPSQPAVFSGTVGSQFTANVVIQEPDSLNGYDVSVKTDPNILAPLNISFTNIVFPASTIAPPINDSINAKAGIAHLELVALGFLTTPPTKGLLFSIVYKVLAPTSGTPIAFQTGCSLSSFQDTCVVIANPGLVPETVQNATFSAGGLAGQYWNSSFFGAPMSGPLNLPVSPTSPPTATASDANISFATIYGYGWHPFSYGTFSVEWNGTITAAFAGTYGFQLSSDDGSWLFIDSALVINNGGPHGPSTIAGSVSLPQGLHRIAVFFFECCGGQSGVDLYWKPPGAPSFTIVPSSAFQQQPQQMFTLNVQVTDSTGSPIANATVKAHTSVGVLENSGSTDNRGMSTTVLPEGSYNVSASHAGYLGTSQTVDLNSNENITLTLARPYLFLGEIPDSHISIQEVAGGFNISLLNMFTQSSSDVFLDWKPEGTLPQNGSSTFLFDHLPNLVVEAATMGSRDYPDAWSKHPLPIALPPTTGKEGAMMAEPVPYAAASIFVIPYPPVQGQNTTIGVVLHNPFNKTLHISRVDFELSGLNIGGYFSSVGFVSDVTLAANETRAVSILWLATVSGHHCIRVVLSYSPASETVQKNIDIEAGMIPGQAGHVSFSIKNPYETAQKVTLKVSTPNLPSKWTAKFQANGIVWDGSSNITISMGPGESVNGILDITSDPSTPGTAVVDVQGFVNRTLIGGVRKIMVTLASSFQPLCIGGTVDLPTFATSADLSLAFGAGVGIFEASGSISGSFGFSATLSETSQICAGATNPLDPSTYSVNAVFSITRHVTLKTDLTLSGSFKANIPIPGLNVGGIGPVTPLIIVEAKGSVRAKVEASLDSRTTYIISCSVQAGCTGTRAPLECLSSPDHPNAPLARPEDGCISRISTSSICLAGSLRIGAGIQFGFKILSIVELTATPEAFFQLEGSACLTSASSPGGGSAGAVSSWELDFGIGVVFKAKLGAYFNSLTLELILQLFKSDTSPLVISHGSGNADQSSTTGVAVNINGSSSPDGTVGTLTSTSLGSFHPNTPAPPLDVSFYNISISGVQGGISRVCITNSEVSSKTIMEFWNGSTWVDAGYIPPSGGLVCGVIPVSALGGTLIAIGSPFPARFEVSSHFTDGDQNPLPTDSQGSPEVRVVLSGGKMPKVASTNPGQLLAWVNVTDVGGGSVRSLQLNETLPKDWVVHPAWLPAKGAIHVYFVYSNGTRMDITSLASVQVASGNPEELLIDISNMTAAAGSVLQAGEGILVSVQLSYGLKGTSQTFNSYPRSYSDATSLNAWTGTSMIGVESSQLTSASFTASVKLPGDVNGDGKVDILDVALVGRAFGSRPGDSTWNPAADLTNAGVINIQDVALVAFYFGTHA